MTFGRIIANSSPPWRAAVSIERREKRKIRAKRHCDPDVNTIFKNFLHLADLLFDFPAYVIALALAFQVQGHSRRSLMDQPFSNSVLK
jgi:hypothetical protein